MLTGQVSRADAGATVTTPTPTEAADLAWKYDFKDGASWATVSDLLVVGGDVYLVASGKIQRIDGDIGKPVATTPCKRGHTSTSAVLFMPTD
ncbi:MAG: hypothetical protein ACLT98_01085 [Eggerthellaceae bacterium]